MCLKRVAPNLHKSLSPQEHQAEEEQRLRLVSLNTQLTGELRRAKPDQAHVTELKTGLEKARLEYEALETTPLCRTPGTESPPW